jgi:hypothetical protein
MKRYAVVIQEVTLTYEFEESANLSSDDEMAMIRERVKTDSPIGLLEKNSIIKILSLTNVKPPTVK